jgi:hypothetical protein
MTPFLSVSATSLVHDAAEPLEGALLARDPVEVGPARAERRVHGGGGVAARLQVAVQLLHVLDDGDHGRGADAQPHQQHHVVLLVVLRRRAVGTVDQNLGEAVRRTILILFLLV